MKTLNPFTTYKLFLKNNNCSYLYFLNILKYKLVANADKVY